MSFDTKTFLSVYVVWHPASKENKRLAERIYDHYRRELFSDVGGSSGLDVIFRSEALGTRPLAIPSNAACATSVVVLLDDALAADAEYVEYVRLLVEEADREGYTARVLIISLTQAAQSALGSETQALGWYDWDGLITAEKEERLLCEITYSLCRTLRHFVENHPAQDLAAFLKPFRIFLSHSKWDKGNEGEDIAKAIRDRIHASNDLASFFDVQDIPAGTKFSRVLAHYVQNSAVVAIQTDTFASREWCRREVLEAKLHDRPMIVVGCVCDGEERVFPYLGNVPLVRMEPSARHRVVNVVSRLLDEVLAQFLWSCRIWDKAKTGVLFISHQPELLALARVGSSTTIVHPDPPLGAEEVALFNACAPSLTILSYTQWIATA